MKLERLLLNIKILKSGNLNLDDDISLITSDSRRVAEGSIFTAIKGSLGDGHDYVNIAVNNGANYIFTEKDLGLTNQILVKNTRKAYALLNANFNDNPSKKMNLIGITGTNGKTTVATVAKQVLDNLGYKTGLIGTVGNYIGDVLLPAKHTTPDPAELHVILDKMYKAGCEYVLMETSSHGFDQHRLEGCHFKIGVFTNLTQEHLDYHKTMENYYQAKKKLFLNCDKAIVSIDDEYGKRLYGELDELIFKKTIKSKKTFSIKDKKADYFPKNIKKDSTFVNFNLSLEKEEENITFLMPGNYSISNALAVIAILKELLIPLEDIKKGLKKAGSVPGRTEILYKKEFTVIRDYAHSADGLYNLLLTVREFAKKRVLCVFGCPGRRDRSARPKMAEVVANLSDFYIITSDNPREEDEIKIINEALKGSRKIDTEHEIYTDRYEAIKRILDIARKDDIIILAGKGHEDYQVLKYGTIHFDEKQIVNLLLK